MSRWFSRWILILLQLSPTNLPRVRRLRHNHRCLRRNIRSPHRFSPCRPLSFPSRLHRLRPITRLRILNLPHLRRSKPHPLQRQSPRRNRPATNRVLNRAPNPLRHPRYKPQRHRKQSPRRNQSATNRVLNRTPPSNRRNLFARHQSWNHRQSLRHIRWYHRNRRWRPHRQPQRLLRVLRPLCRNRPHPG